MGYRDKRISKVLQNDEMFELVMKAALGRTLRIAEADWGFDTFIVEAIRGVENYFTLVADEIHNGLIPIMNEEITRVPMDEYSESGQSLYYHNKAVQWLFEGKNVFWSVASDAYLDAECYFEDDDSFEEALSVFTGQLHIFLPENTIAELFPEKYGLFMLGFQKDFDCRWACSFLNGTIDWRYSESEDPDQYSDEDDEDLTSFDASEMEGV